MIAWLLLVGCFFFPLNLAWHAPAILFTKIFAGWPAGLYYLILTGAQLFIGIGLLRLKPAARTAAIIYYLFFFLSAAAFRFSPGSTARWGALMESERSMFPWMRMLPNQPEFHFDATPFLVFGFVFGLLAMMIPLYFLITRKVAFERAASSDAAASLG